MTVTAVALGLVCLVLLWLLRDQQKRHQEALDQREAAWTGERRELLTRIQRPDLLPTPRPGRTPAPRETDHRALATDGTDGAR